MSASVRISVKKALAHLSSFQYRLVGRNTVRVLMYHRVTDEPVDYEYTVTPGDFRQQIEYLRDAGYHFLSLEEVTSFVTQRSQVPFPAVALTFDDGYEETYLNVFPVLEEMGAKAALFIVNGFMGKTNSWDSESGSPEARLMNREQIQDLARRGFTVGAHSLSHKLLPGLKEKEAREEICASKSHLEDILGQPVLFFAYPYGEYDGAARALVAECGFKAGFSTWWGLARRRDNPHALKRSAIRKDDLASFMSILRGYQDWRSLAESPFGNLLRPLFR